MIIAFYSIYGFGRLKQRTTCVFNKFQSYDNIAEKGCAGGLKITLLVQYAFIRLHFWFTVSVQYAIIRLHFWFTVSVIVLSRKSMSTSTNCYLIGLAIADLLFLIIFSTVLADHHFEQDSKAFYMYQVRPLISHFDSIWC